MSLPEPGGGRRSPRGPDEAISLAGTCLSRALAVAAAVNGAEVVIGVTALKGPRVSAHAWLEIQGVRVDTNPDGGSPLPDELARLPSRKIDGAGQARYT